MARYKGPHEPEAIERNFPYIVQVAVPPGSLGKRLSDALLSTRRRALAALIPPPRL